MAEPRGMPVFNEFSRQYTFELDYIQERINLKDVYESIMPVFDGQVGSLPLPFGPY